MKRAIRQRYGRSGSDALTVADVEKLPHGSLVWWNGQGFVAVPGGLAPVSILSKRADGRVPDGEAVASFGEPFALIATGRGQVPTYETAQRKVVAWWASRPISR